MTRLLLLLALITSFSHRAFSQSLTVIDQDYREALAVAARTDKLVFVDFYTTWCQPCKKLDKLIFSNDSIGQILGKHFVLLKYDAENDSTFHLSKKHHVSSYPTGLLLTAGGSVLARKYGFAGEDFEPLAQSVLAFADEGVRRSAADSIFAGYASDIDPNQYPTFYRDYVERTNTKIDSVIFANYWTETHDPYSEGYVSTLLYFAGDNLPPEVTDHFLNHRDKYAELFGTVDVNVALMFMTYHRLGAAVSAQSPTQFAAAAAWARRALDPDFAERVVGMFEAKLREAGEK